MKKFTSLMLALIMAVSVCAFASAEGRVEVEFWYGLGGATGEIVQKTIEEFNAMQDKYTVIGVTKGSYTETFQEIQAPIAAGNPPALTILEYSHRLYKNMFWQIGYSYRAYEAGDSYVLYPGLIYYFGDNYISATYGPNWIEDRDTGFSGSVKGNFFITEFLQLWSGVAFGQRLYDIYGLDAHAENGFILFGGITLKVYKGINVRVGGSYGEEEPKFIKRSLIFDASVKF